MKPYKFSNGQMPIIVYAETFAEAQKIYQDRMNGKD